MKLSNKDKLIIALFIIIVFAASCILIPLFIHLIFKGLLFMINEPIQSMIYTGIFLAGGFLNRIFTNIDSK